MKKLLPVICILMFLLPCLFLSACKTSRRAEGSAQKITVTFWHSMGLQHSKVLNKIIADFESQYPQIHINPVYQGGYTQLLTNLTASCTAGTNPVMSQMYESWTTRFLDHDLLTSVDDLDKKYRGLSPESRSDIPEVFIKDNSWNGKLVTLPFNKSAYMLFYNKDALKEIGFVNEKGEGRPPVTWSEFRDAALKMTRREGAEVRRYGYGVRPFIEGFTFFLFRAGGQYLDPDGKKVLFADETGRMTLNFLVDMKGKDGSVYVEPGYLDTPFGTGRIAMCVNSTAGLPYTEKAVAGRFAWDIAPIPYPDGKEDVARTLFQGTNIGIFKNHPEEKIAAAWKFMSYLTDTKSATVWSVGTGYLPIRYSVMKTDMMNEYLKNNPRYAAAAALLDNGIFEPRVLTWEPMRTVITDYFEAALNCRRSTEQTINAMKEKCEKIIRTF